MDEAAKKRALRMVPYGLYLLGCRRKEPGGPQDYHAYVVSWVAQCSFKPPMLVVMMGRESLGLQLVRESGVFSLNFLGAEQKDVAKVFFKELDKDQDVLGGQRYVRGAATGCPVFVDLPAFVECEVVDVVERGNDHCVVLGRVVEAGAPREAEPLTTRGTGWTYAG